jgi:hypothetical protein
VQAFQDRDRETVKVWMSKHLVDFRRGYDFAGLDIDDVADSRVARMRKK